MLQLVQLFQVLLLTVIHTFLFLTQSLPLLGERLKQGWLVDSNALIGEGFTWLTSETWRPCFIISTLFSLAQSINAFIGLNTVPSLRTVLIPA